MLSQAQNGLPPVSRGDILELQKKYIIEADVLELPSVVVVRVWLKTVLYEGYERRLGQTFGGIVDYSYYLIDLLGYDLREFNSIDRPVFPKGRATRNG